LAFCEGILAVSTRADIASGLVLRLNLNEATGLSAADSSLKGNDAVLQSFVGDDSQWVAGRLQGGLRFNADGSGANVATIADNGTLNFSSNDTSALSFSLAVWVKGTTVQTNSGGIIAKGGGGGGEQYCLDCFNGAFRFFVRSATGTAPGVSASVDDLNGHPNGL
jgi:hypothetical protein